MSWNNDNNNSWNSWNSNSTNNTFSTPTFTSYGNGGYAQVPSDIWNAPNGTYGVKIPPFGSLGNSNTTPQISGTTVVKGNGYVRYEYPSGQFEVFTEDGGYNSGWKP